MRKAHMLTHILLSIVILLLLSGFYTLSIVVITVGKQVKNQNIQLQEIKALQQEILERVLDVHEHVESLPVDSTESSALPILPKIRVETYSDNSIKEDI